MKYSIPQELIDSGRISVDRHPDFDYFIYSGESIYNGYILNSKGHLIARPPAYFEPIVDYKHTYSNDPIDVYEYVEGIDLIGFYSPQGEYLLTERHAFLTPFGTLANRIFENTYSEYAFDEDYTFLYKYTGSDDNRCIILVGGTNKETGESVSVDILREYSILMHIPIPSHTRFDSQKEYFDFKETNSIEDTAIMVFKNGLRILA